MSSRWHHTKISSPVIWNSPMSFQTTTPKLAIPFLKTASTLIFSQLGFGGSQRCGWRTPSFCCCEVVTIDLWKSCKNPRYFRGIEWGGVFVLENKIIFLVPYASKYNCYSTEHPTFYQIILLQLVQIIKSRNSENNRTNPKTSPNLLCICAIEQCVSLILICLSPTGIGGILNYYLDTSNYIFMAMSEYTIYKNIGFSDEPQISKLSPKRFSNYVWFETWFIQQRSSLNASLLISSC